MGYEVLDADGDSSAASGPSGPPLQVTDLDDLPRLEPAPPPDPRRWLARLREHPVVAVAAVVGVVVGALAGAGAATHHAGRTEDLAARGTLAVTALSQSYTVTDAGQQDASVDLVVRLFNTGPRPVDVVQSAPNAQPSAAHPVVQTFGGSPRLQPGEDLAMSVDTALDCSSHEPLQVTVPVRTQDGRVRPVDVRRGEVEPLVPVELCTTDQPPRQPSAWVSGSFAHPVLALGNPTNRWVTVHLDPSSSVLIAESDLVRVSTSPQLPVRVAPHSTTHLDLRVTARRCVRDVVLVQSDGAQLDLLADSAPLGTIGPERTSMAVELTALVAAAVQQRCS